MFTGGDKKSRANGQRLRSKETGISWRFSSHKKFGAAKNFRGLSQLVCHLSAVDFFANLQM
jgi:hypothetical protein